MYLLPKPGCIGILTHLFLLIKPQSWKDHMIHQAQVYAHEKQTGNSYVSSQPSTTPGIVVVVEVDFFALGRQINLKSPFFIVPGADQWGWFLHLTGDGLLLSAQTARQGGILNLKEISQKGLTPLCI